MFKNQVEPRAAGEWFHCQVLNMLWRHIIVCKSIDHRKLLLICFLQKHGKSTRNWLYFQLRRRAWYIWRQFLLSVLLQTIVTSQPGRENFDKYCKNKKINTKNTTILATDKRSGKQVEFTHSILFCWNKCVWKRKSEQISPESAAVPNRSNPVTRKQVILGQSARKGQDQITWEDTNLWMSKSFLFLPSVFVILTKEPVSLFTKITTLMPRHPSISFLNILYLIYPSRPTQYLDIFTWKSRIPITTSGASFCEPKHL